MTDAEILQHWRKGFVFRHVDGGRRRIVGVEGGLIWFTPDDGDGVTTAVPWDQMAKVVGNPPAPARPAAHRIRVGRRQNWKW